MTSDLFVRWAQFIVTGLTFAFGAGAFVALTRNHLKHLQADVKKVLKIQKRQGQRIMRIERRMPNGR